MVCAHCGSECPAEHLYCGKCGRSIDGGDTGGAATTYRPRSVALRREATIVALALVLIAASAFGAWYGLFYQRSPEMVVQRFVDADLQDKFALQNQYLVDRLDSRVVLSAFQAIRQHTGSSPFKDYRIVGTSASGNTAYVNVELRFSLPVVPGVNAPPALPAPAVGTPGSTVVPFAFVLTVEKGEWKIDGSQTLANAAGALAAVGYTQLAPLINGVPTITIPNLGPPGGAPPAPPRSGSGAATLL